MKSFILSLVLLVIYSTANATHIGGKSLLGGGVRDEASPCHVFVIETWFTGNTIPVTNGNKIMAINKDASKLGFTIDDLLYISMMRIIDSALAYKEAYRICGLNGK